MSELVLTRLEDTTLVITMNRPDRKNALTLAMYTAMANALHGAAGDPNVTAVVIEGAGSAFCAGNDLTDFVKNPPAGHDSPVLRFLDTLSTFPKPVIGAVHGVAVGIGTTMLLHCDLVYATKGTRFRLPFTFLALVPEAASSFILPRMMGHQRASELLLLGEFFGIDLAEQVQLLNGVGDTREHTIDLAMEAAGKFAQLPSESVRLTKMLLKRPTAQAVSETMAYEVGLFQERLASAEFKEAVSAFFEKRAPKYR